MPGHITSGLVKVSLRLETEALSLYLLHIYICGLHVCVCHKYIEVSTICCVPQQHVFQS